MRAAILVLVLAVSGVARADDGSAAMPPNAADLRKTCVDAMNANPAFAKSIVEVADKEAGERRAQQDNDAREQRALTIAKDERQVILAYIAMWVVAAGFLLFLWLRQMGLKSEIALLRRDLEAAAKDDK